MISKYSHKDLAWVDLVSPTEEEILHVLEEYSIPHQIKEKIINNDNEDNISLNYDLIFISLIFPHVSIGNNNNQIIFIVKDDFVLTIHKEPIHAIDSFSKEMEKDIITGEKSKINTGKLLFSHMLKNLYMDSQQKVVNNNTEINKLRLEISKKIKRIKQLKITAVVLLLIIILIICL